MHLELRVMSTGGVTCRSTKDTTRISAMAGYGAKYWTQMGNFSSKVIQLVVRSVHQMGSFELVLPLLLIGAFHASPC